MSPLEHSVFTFRISAPVFVSREFVRHRIASYNEVSGRYKELEPIFYVPTKDRKVRQIGKTGDYNFEFDRELQAASVDIIEEASLLAWVRYENLLDAGVAKEVARMVLPVNIYSTWYATLNARSLLNFLNLRNADNAQHEIRMVAEKMEKIFENKMPDTYLAWQMHGRSKA